MSIKNIAFFLLLALPFGAQAQTIAEANQQVIDACKKSGGEFKGFMAGECEYQRCQYKDNKSDGKFYRSGDNEKTNCTKEQLKKALESARDGLDIDLDPRKGTPGGAGSTGGAAAGGANAGATAGATAGANAGADDGAVVCYELENNVIMTPGAPCYKQCTTKPLFGKRKFDLGKKGCIDCLLANGYRIKPEFLPKDKNGNLRGAVQARGVTVGTGVIVCEWVPNNKLGRTGTFNGTGGTCPTDSRPVGGSGSVGGNGGRGGPGVTVVGSNNGPGIGGNGTTIVTGNGVGGGGVPGRIVSVSGGASAGVGGGAQVTITAATGGAAGGAALPAVCNSTDKKDIKACEKLLKAMGKNGRFRYSSGSDGVDLASIHDGYIVDCPNCAAGRREKQSFLSGAAELVGALAPIGVAGLTGYFGYKSNKAWAGAAKVGFEQCQLDHNNYYNYLGANELPGLTPEQQAAMGCNGFQLGGFGGLGGMYGGLMGAGYSPGFIGGMMGPYGGYNPYGMGGQVGGAVGGMYPGGMGGGFVQGGTFVAGMGGGMYPAGMGGGMYAAGVAGGMYPAGMGGGMYAAGVAGGMYSAGMGGGMYPAGMGGGFVQGGTFAAGINGGGMYPAGMGGGYVAGGMYPAGMGGGMYPAGMGGGFVQGGTFAAGVNGGGMYPAGMGGGYAAGGMYPAGMGGGIGVGIGGGLGGYPGGYGTGMGGAWGAGGAYPGGYGPMGYPGGGYYGNTMGGYGGIQASMQASNRDVMLQQQGVNMQIQGITSGSWGAGGVSMGTAAFSPMNMGYGLGTNMYMGM